MTFPQPPTEAEIISFSSVYGQIASNVEAVLLGKPETVRLALTALFAEGHLLIEDVPGVGKTTIARAIAASVRGEWRRIQFTPDLLPSDVSGVTIFNQGSREFEFHKGPVFSNIVIADEINRASPKTQSALLEVMEERNVTIDGVGHPVPRPFMVVATQNPIEMDGTYRLPEAQLDRFAMRIKVGYPSHGVEIEVLRNAMLGRTTDDLDAVTDTKAIEDLIKLAHRVYVADALYDFAVRLATATREADQVRVGVSPRGVIALTRAAQVYALAQGRPYVIPEDVKVLVEPVFAHRMIIAPEAQLRGRSASEILAELLEQVPVPQPGAETPTQPAGYVGAPAPEGQPAATVPGR